MSYLKPHDRSNYILAIQQLAPRYAEQVSFWCRLTSAGYPGFEIRILRANTSKSEITAKSEITSKSEKDQQIQIHITPRVVSERTTDCLKSRDSVHQFRSPQSLETLYEDLKSGLEDTNSRFDIAHQISEDMIRESAQLTIAIPPGREPENKYSLIPVIRIREECSALLEQLLPEGPDLPLAIKQTLGSTPLQSNASITAERLGISHRSMQRKLQYAGISFGEIQEQALLSLMIDQLQQSDISITCLAAELGFENVSNLGRFCKRHFGTSPKVLRQQLTQEWN